jgi:serine/threonine protein kinase
LQKILDAEAEEHRKSRISPIRNPSVWARHVTWAKVLMAGIEALHRSKIAHADLKPANVYLIQDPTIKAGYQLKLIDMDFSLLTDHRAPWHGHQGYIGSDNYRSPEHLTRRLVPDTRSDIFTCGLILSELLTGRHPYWSEDQGEYAKKALSYETRPLPLAGVMPSPAQNAAVSLSLHRCLSPNPVERPTATELREVLSGRTSEGRTSDKSPQSPTRRHGAAREPLTSKLLELQHSSGRCLRIGVRTELTRSLLEQLGPEAHFWDVKQCVIDRDSQGQWFLTPAEVTVNETLLNTATVTRPVLLSAGDSIAVGRQAKGVVKMPLTVRGV